MQSTISIPLEPDLNNPPVVYRQNGQNDTEFQTAPENQNKYQAIKNGFYAKINKPKPEQCSSNL